MRTLCLDVGEKRIGVAVSDPLNLTAQGVETIPNRGFARVLQRLKELSEGYDTKRLVLGLPRNMDGSEGFQAERIRAFAKKLEAEGFEVLYQDERMTTLQARGALIEGGVRRQDRKASVDMLAATYILETWMARQRPPRRKRFIGGIYRMSDLEKNLPGEDELNEEIDEEIDEEGIVQLVDEEGNEVDFELLMTLEFKGRVYICLVPVEPMEDVEEDELIILRTETDEDGNDIYASIDDEDELQAVFEEYLRLAEADE